MGKRNIDQVVKLQGCSNITSAMITIKPGALNLFHGMNGVGKSTISKAIAAQARGRTFDDLVPYGKDLVPSVTGVEADTSIAVFDERYVSESMFPDGDSVFKDGYRVFIETEEYRKSLEKTRSILEEATAVFNEDESLKELIDVTDELIASYGNSKTGYSGSSSMGKGSIGKGDKVSAIPASFEDYTPLIQDSGISAKWIAWHKSGREYTGHAICPYCGHGIGEVEMETALALDDEYGSKYLDHTVKVATTFERLRPYFSESAAETMSAILENAIGADAMQKAKLENLRTTATALNTKLREIKNLDYPSLYKSDDLTGKLTNLKIQENLLGEFDSDIVNEKVSTVNERLDTLIAGVIELKKAIGIQNTELKKTIRESEDEIDGFLASAGYPYKVSVDAEDGLRCSLKLKPSGLDEAVTDAASHLSFGERNALAIALFSCQVKKDDPDTIILDDPISSFDENKKYAILYFLFCKPGLLKGKTTLLFTHDFDVVNYVKRIYPEVFKEADAVFIRNDKGMICGTPISTDDIHSCIKHLKLGICSCEKPRVLRYIYARKLEEITKGKSIAWDMLSSLIHKREFPCRKTSESSFPPLSEEECKEATKEIRLLGIADFDYVEALEGVKDDKNVLAAYEAAEGSYEKIALYRIISLDNPAMREAAERSGVVAPINDFINSFFHIENESLFQLDNSRYDTVPEYITTKCDAAIAEYSSRAE